MAGALQHLKDEWMWQPAVFGVVRGCRGKEGMERGELTLAELEPKRQPAGMPTGCNLVCWFSFHSPWFAQGALGICHVKIPKQQDALQGTWEPLN